MASAARVITAQTIDSRRTATSRGLFLALLAVLLPLGIVSLVLPPPVVLAILPPSVLMCIWIWRKPIRGLYLILIGAMMIEILPLQFPDSLTDRIPLFLNLNNSGILGYYSINPAEILMLTVIAIWVASTVSARTFRLPAGRVVRPYAIFMAVVLGAEVIGLLAGGDFKLSLWELRPQVYGFIAFVLAASLIVERADVRRLSVIFFLAVGIKAFLAFYRYYFTLHRVLGGWLRESIMAHEESYFWAVFLIAVLAALIYYRRQRPLVPLLLASPLVLFVLYQNQRRAGEFAFIIGGAVIVLLGVGFEPAARRHLIAGTVTVTVAFALFTAVFWDQQRGFAAEVVRPVRSLIQPSQRDYLSNIYPTAENANLHLSFQSCPVVGMGFGRPFLVVFPQANIAYIDPLWNIIPHNNLLWIGVRMGAVGFMAFWALIGMAILEGTRQLAVRRDPLLRAAAAFAIGAIIAEVVVASGDLQLENYRNILFFGATLGLLDALPRVADA